MKKKEIMIISVIFIVSLIGVLGIKWFQNKDVSDKEVLIKHDGVIINRIKLSKETEETFQFKKGNAFNTVEVRNGEAYIHDASCRDQICVRHPHISKNGEIIVCLPNKLVVEIHSDSESIEIDSVVE